MSGTMKPALVALLVIAGASIAAQAPNPPGFRHWNAAELKRYTQTLAPKMGPQKAITEGLQRYDRVYFAMVHREASSQGEAHSDVSDTYIVQTGAATLVVGGEIVGAQVSPTGEVRGTHIKNGASSRILPGDIVHIQAGMNHQILIDSGGQVTYAIMKITDR